VELLQGLNMNKAVTNFREVCMGNIAHNTLYRSNHPMTDGEQNSIIANLAEDANIQCVLNLHDSETQMRSEQGESWYHRLIKSECAIALNMDFNFMSDEFTEKLRKGLLYMLWHNVPYLIHCLAGFDRTGFVCAVLEALMGSTLQEIVDDYCISFGRRFTSAIQNDNTEQPAILAQLKSMNNDVPVTDKNLQCTAEQYLLKKVGLRKEDLAELKNKLSRMN
jgi:protein tyrosine/serine phosphatase